MKLNDFRHWTTERISQTILYVLVGLSMVVFILFWTVGFDRPSFDSPNFNDPVFTDALIVLMWLMLIGILGITIWSIATTLKKRGKAQRLENGIPVKKISYGVLIGTLILLILSLAFGSTEPMRINGVMFTDKFWLRISDMFISMSVIMMIVAVAAVVYSGWRNRRLHRKEGK
ncbi:MAG: hypothetical protein ACOYJG_07435 [Prevotella sp.]|jgi:magnesium-transporting ATPase (P-type)